MEKEAPSTCEAKSEDCDGCKEEKYKEVNKV